MSAGRRGTRLLAAVLPCVLAGCSALPSIPFVGGKGDEERPAPLARAELTGVTGPLADNVRQHLSLLRQRCDAPERLVDAAFARAADEAREALRAFGHYEPAIQVARDRAEDGCPVVRLDITPGPPVMLTDVEVEVRGADDDPGLATLVEALPLAPDTQLNHGTYTTARNLIESWAAERGYFDGRFTERALRVNPRERRASAVLRYDAGPRYRFGELILTQRPEALDRALIERFIGIEPGEPYDAGRITEMTNALVQSGYFSEVDVRPRLEAKEDAAVPLALDLTARPRHSFTAGIGFSTDEALRGRFDYLDRRFNDLGHRIAAGARASRINQQGSVEYRVPRGDPRQEWLAYRGGLRRREVDSYDTVETQLGVTDTRLRPFGWLETRFVQFEHQEFEIASQGDDSIFLVPGVRYAKTDVDAELYPTRGYRLQADLRFAAEPLLSDTSFARALLSASWVRSTSWAARWLLRADLGAVWVDDFLALPPSLRFFAGGDQSIRGYDLDTLGPEDASGDVLGGTYLAAVSIEYEQPVVERWSVAGFVDAGNAFGGEGTSTGIATSFGVGLRWRSPIGPVRLDLAHPLDAPPAVRVHVRIGPDL